MEFLKNSVRLSGTIGGELISRKFRNGTIQLRTMLTTKDRFSLAGGEASEQEQIHQLVAWGKTAEMMRQYLKKGMKVVVEGKLVSHSIAGPAGSTLVITEILVKAFMRMKSKSQAA